MVRVSNYRHAKDVLLTYMSAKGPGEISRAWVAGNLGVSVSTAGNYLMTLAQEFPENLRYARGVLVVFSSIPEMRLPVETRMRMKEAKIQEIKKLSEAISKNHLTHNDLEALKGVLSKLTKEIDAL